MKTARELLAERAEKLESAMRMIETAEGENRNMTPEEKESYDGLLATAADLEERANRMESLPQFTREDGKRVAPSHNRIKLGDSEIRALAHYCRTGDSGGVRSMMEPGESGRPEVRVDIPTSLQMRALDFANMERRAAVDSIMNITTAADGGNMVPTGFSGKVAMRRNEVRLSDRLGCMLVPGKGTTVAFPFENADPTVFAATTEQDDSYAQTYERDVAPVTGSKSFTLAKKTKKLALTEELMDDEDVGLMMWIADTVGRGIGITHNSMLLTEVASNGTALKTFASASAIAAGEPDDFVYHDTVAYYMDDGDNPAWVMRPTTFGAIKKISGNARTYDDQTGSQKRELLEYPVNYSNQAAAIAASAKSVYFGNWYYVGFREDPALRFLRDPYTTDGIVYLKYSFRAVYGVLIAGAVGYGAHPSA